MSSRANRPFTKVVVIGAGFSGLTMACQLQRRLNCNDYVIYDRSPAPGGTWWANKCSLASLHQASKTVDTNTIKKTQDAPSISQLFSIACRLPRIPSSPKYSPHRPRSWNISTTLRQSSMCLNISLLIWSGRELAGRG